MWQNAHDTYLESRILSADPVELTGMLYQAAIQAVKDARGHLAAGEIAARARSISKASSVLIELATALDHARGGEISRNLARLYDYLLRRLTEANLQQSDPILDEVQRLLTTVAEGWEGVKGQKVKVAPAPTPAPTNSASWAQPGQDSGKDSWSELDAAATTTYTRMAEQTSYTPEPAPSMAASAAAEAQQPAWEPPAVTPNPSEPEPPSDNPWTPVSSYGNAWMPQEVTTGYSQHDWSL